jgi:acetoacetyl-CoA synthetase
MNNVANTLWSPDEKRIQKARITDYTQWLSQTRLLDFGSYESLWQWSVDCPEAFWTSVVDYFDIRLDGECHEVVSQDDMPYVKWFEGTCTNFSSQVFRNKNSESPALVYDSEVFEVGEISWDELEIRVAALAHFLRQQGVKPGQRVVACLPNTPHTVIALLAVASIGAVWSICAPEMGPVSIIDRFGQITPVVMITCDGYRYGGRDFSKLDVVENVIASIDSIHTVIMVPLLGLLDDNTRVMAGKSLYFWNQAVSGEHSLEIESLPFSHPLWIVYSSGTTGIPKAIVHGHGGIILGNMVSLGFHTDLAAGDRYCWIASTGWIVWNVLVCGLLVGSSVCLFDGALTGTSATPDWRHLWRFVSDNKIRVFGASAGFFASCLKAGIEPANDLDLACVESLISSGSPLAPESYHWIYKQLPDVWLSSGSGGTDIAGAFINGLPTLPVREGEMQCRVLGTAVYAYNDHGQPVMGEVGELVCTKPLPSMPLYFWGDENMERYLDSYFGMFTGHDTGKPVWRHGDWLELRNNEESVAAIIYGRSDATINRGGIRMGTSEIYRVVDHISEVSESMVVDLEYLGKPSRLLLFINVFDPADAGAELENKICANIRRSLSPRYVPDAVFYVPGIPRNLTGKKLELPIKKLLLGFEPEKVAKRDALANPDIFDWYVHNFNRFI